MRDQQNLTVQPLLDEIRAQAGTADESRSVATSVIDGLKDNPIMRFSASENLGGLACPMFDIGEELEAVASACGSTAWVLWNHLATFHLFAGLLGPEQKVFLSDIVAKGEWVCFPAGASTGVKATPAGDKFTLAGKAAFGSGARYADWAGVAFVIEDRTAPQFSMVKLNQAGVKIDPDWRAMSLRASATDTVYYSGVGLAANRVVPFHFRYREVFRDPAHAMIDHRYREDWVALSDLWLAMMAVGVLQANLDEVTQGIKDRVAIGGVKVAERPTVHVNLGQAKASIDAARDTAVTALLETDQRIEQNIIPAEVHYLRQMSASMAALKLCNEAMGLLLRVMGGNGLREGPSFERRYRDFQAMPLHINAHQDRLSEQIGRNLLGLPTENPF
ncbi:MAG: hypothetical protein GKR90_04020 [Pseudomonadales bacterium]|nr:hypothetical protein [Pseudomonadales bacterium]